MFQLFVDKKLESIATTMNINNSNEIFSFDYEGKRFWLKKARATSSNIFHQIFYKVLSLNILIPVQKKTPSESVLYETSKIIDLKKSSVNVPNVIGANKNFFVLEDTGKTIYHYLKNKKYDNELKKNILHKTVFELAKIHRKDYFHGGAQIRNFTYKEGNVFAIDFEDSFDSEYKLKSLQFRDLFLFLVSLTKIKDYEFSFQEVINDYIENSTNKEFLRLLIELKNKVSFLTTLGNLNFINELLPQDAKDFLKLLNEIDKLEG